MEEWEKKRRAELQLEVKNGVYNIGTKPTVCWTGKGGYINFIISLEKAIKNYLKTN